MKHRCRETHLPGFAALVALIGVLTVPTLPAQAGGVDGVVTVSDGYGPARAIQNNATNFGDNFNELDALYALLTPSSLKLAIPGNLDSGNAIVLYLDTAPGGSGTLGGSAGPFYVHGQNGLKFDSGFAPEYALAMNRFLGTVYLDLVNLTTDSSSFLGSVDIGSVADITGGKAAFDDSNTAGVGGGTGADDGSSATHGLELELSQSLLNLGSSVGIQALLTNNGDGYASNQSLAGLGSGFDNLGFGPGGFPTGSAIDFTQIPGQQYVVVQGVPEPGALALLFGAGLLGAGFVARRRA